MTDSPNYGSTSFVSGDSESIRNMANNSVENKPNQQQYDPPYMIRHSRAFRHFKNPPQPHMCIKDYTDDGQELFINVMSWTKICMPHSASDPIPLYGGMRVNSGSPKSPSLVFAVMANPAILKHVGRKCSDMEEKYALVKLMCDFVEAMNPGLKLARDAEVLEDRDLSGELKDIWGAVQAKRLREKDSAPSYESYLATQNQIYIDFGPDTAYQTDSMPLNSNETPNPNNNKEINHVISVLNVDEVCNASVQQPPEIGVTITNTTTTLPPNNTNFDSELVKKIPIKLDEKVETETNSSHVNGETISKVTKKEKLSGFLPNGCHNIFPFIKTKNSHDKHANKDKNDLHKENGSRKLINNKDNKYIQNKDTPINLESDFSKLDVTKSQQ